METSCLVGCLEWLKPSGLRKWFQGTALALGLNLASGWLKKTLDQLIYCYESSPPWDILRKAFHYSVKSEQAFKITKCDKWRHVSVAKWCFPLSHQNPLCTLCKLRGEVLLCLPGDEDEVSPIKYNHKQVANYTEALKGEIPHHGLKLQDAAFQLQLYRFK